MGQPPSPKARRGPRAVAHSVPWKILVKRLSRDYGRLKNGAKSKEKLLKQLILTSGRASTPLKRGVNETARYFVELAEVIALLFCSRGHLVARETSSHIFDNLTLGEFAHRQVSRPGEF